MLGGDAVHRVSLNHVKPSISSPSLMLDPLLLLVESAADPYLS